MPRNPGRAGHRWRQARAATLAASDTCWICGTHVDHNAPPRTRWAPTVDHITPLSHGGDPHDLGNLRVAHYGCNARRSNHLDTKPTRTSRRW